MPGLSGNRSSEDLSGVIFHSKNGDVPMRLGRCLINDVIRIYGEQHPPSECLHFRLTT
jgi:hypothetical protein